MWSIRIVGIIVAVWILTIIVDTIREIGAVGVIFLIVFWSLIISSLKHSINEK